MSNKKILIVDDSLVSRLYFISMLNSLSNVEFIEATNGNDALSKIESANPDCILMDNLMPDKTGIEVLEELNKKNVNIPTIMLTADVQKTTKDRCIELGASDFLCKPVDKEKLITSIKNILDI